MANTDPLGLGPQKAPEPSVPPNTPAPVPPAPPSAPSTSNPFASFVDAIKQVITLAVALLTVAITFGKDMVPADFTGTRIVLVVAWTCLLGSILAGLLAMLKAGGLEPLAKADPSKIKDPVFTKSWSWQLYGFAAGVVLLFLIGVYVLFCGPPPKTP